MASVELQGERMIFRYPGGKSRKAVWSWILEHAPPNFDEYREPFVGGGGVFFQIPTSKRRWINDRHKGLIAVYKALQDRPEEFIKRCRSLKEESLRTVFDRIKLDEHFDPACRYFLVNRVGYAGRVNYDIPSRLYFSNPTGWRIVHGPKMERAAEIVKGVQVTCGDYADLLTTPGKNVFIYLDPPYIKNTKLAKSSRLYQHNFEFEDHARLAELVRACNHRVLLSYDDTPEVRSLYDGFRIIEGGWKYSGTDKAEKDFGKEVLIAN